MARGLVLDIAMDSAKTIAKLSAVRRQIPKVTSRSMQLSSIDARDKARKSAKRRLDRPKPGTIKAIRNRWPSRGQVIAGNANANVHIADFLVDEMHPNVFGGIENRVPKGTKQRQVIFPTDVLRRNQYGNIPGLQSKAGSGGKLRTLATKKNHFEVPLRGNKNPKTRHLPPGIYRVQGKGRRRKLQMLVFYDYSRITKPKWKEYPVVVRKEFDRTFRRYYIAGWNREVAKALGLA